ncbi:MAG: FAD-linked oxidase C-terminal domain-containing protein [Rubrivivax sp.]
MMCGGADAPHRRPVTASAAGHVLIESEGGQPHDDHARFEAVLGALLEEGVIADAAIAQSDAERQALWAVRNDIPRLARTMSPLLAFDVSVTAVQMRSLVDELRAALAARWPQARLVVFGHVADNNLHIVVSLQTPHEAKAVGGLVYGAVAARRGSISAEHGIGSAKREALAALPAGAGARADAPAQGSDGPAGPAQPGQGAGTRCAARTLTPTIDSANAPHHDPGATVACAWRVPLTPARDFALLRVKGSSWGLR